MRDLSFIIGKTISRLWAIGIGFARVTAVIGCIAHSPPLFALTIFPPGPDPWFSSWVQIEEKSLPANVYFRHIRFPHMIVGYFSNLASTPFYLVVAPSSPPRWVSNLPPTFIPNRMAVSGAAFRINRNLSWTREHFPGILVERFIKFPSGQAAGILEMNAYLGDRKIAIRGRYYRERPNRVELDSPLPAPLRLADVHSRKGRFVIANDGAVPLYTGVAFPSPVGWVTEMPLGFLATYKLIAGKTYYGERLHSSTTDGWKVASPYDARLTQRDFERYFPDFKFKQIYRDNRPDNTKAPDPQHFEMTALYGARMITIRGRILYDLNPNYDPLASQGAFICTSCTGSMCDECAANEESLPHRVKKPPLHSSTY